MLQNDQTVSSHELSLDHRALGGMAHSIKTSMDSNATGGAARSAHPLIGRVHRHYLWRCRRIQKLATRKGISSNIYGNFCSQTMIHCQNHRITVRYFADVKGPDRILDHLVDSTFTRLNEYL
jgi:hypothetical protein